MRVVVVYKDQSDHARSVNEWLRDFERRTGFEVERMEPETREGAGFCTAYDVTMYPTILVLGDEGRVLGCWRGEMLPRVGDVAGYLQ